MDTLTRPIPTVTDGEFDWRLPRNMSTPPPNAVARPAAPQINMEPNTGDRRVKDINLFDTRVQKTFTVPSSPVRFDVFGDALNLTNSAQYESVASSIGTATSFGVGTTYIPPRRLMLGAKVRW